MGEQQQFVDPTSCDVLCGAGYETSHHKGNEIFRMIVSKHFEEYYRATCKKAKIVVSRAILSDLLASGARFLKKDGSHNRWIVADIKVGKDKISHALRSLKDAKKKNDYWPHPYPPLPTQIYPTSYEPSYEDDVSESRKTNLAIVVNEEFPSQDYEAEQPSFPLESKSSYSNESKDDCDSRSSRKRLHRDVSHADSHQLITHKVGRSSEQDSKETIYDYWMPYDPDKSHYPDPSRRRSGHTAGESSLVWKSVSGSETSHSLLRYEYLSTNDSHDHISLLAWDQQADLNFHGRADDHYVRSQFREGTRQEQNSSVLVTDGSDVHVVNNALRQPRETVLSNSRRNNDGAYPRYKSTPEDSYPAESSRRTPGVDEGLFDYNHYQYTHRTVNTHDSQTWIDGLERLQSPYPDRSASPNTELANDYPYSSRRMSTHRNYSKEPAIDGSDFYYREDYGTISSRHEDPFPFPYSYNKHYQSIPPNYSDFQGQLPQAYSHFPSWNCHPSQTSNAIGGANLSPIERDTKEQPK